MELIPTHGTRRIILRHWPVINIEELADTSLSLQQLNLLSENLSTFANATGDITRSQTISEWRNSGFFGRVNYDYKNRYLLEVSARYDGTSRFRSDHRWVFVPSASAGWRISEENVFGNLSET